jgi:hypothetical protein
MDREVIVHNIAQSHLSDFSEFAKIVVNQIDSKSQIAWRRASALGRGESKR